MYDTYMTYNAMEKCDRFIPNGIFTCIPQHMHGIGNVTVSSYAGGLKQTSFRAMCSDEAFKPQRKATIETSDEANEFIHEACEIMRVFRCCILST